jgi:hypothetical protein
MHLMEAADLCWDGNKHEIFTSAIKVGFTEANFLNIELWTTIFVVKHVNYVR